MKKPKSLTFQKKNLTILGKITFRFFVNLLILSQAIKSAQTATEYP